MTLNNAAGGATTPPASAAALPASFSARLANALSGASAGAVERGLAESSIAHGKHAFLEDTHPQLLSGQSDYVYTPAEHKSLTAYAAASTLGHCSDAWSYFAQATRAVLAGEFAVAKHLLYYSELRSAFSILARHGILIRSKIHVVLQDDGTATYLEGKNTHDAVWLALKAWAKTGDARSFFLDNVVLDGQSLSSWLDEQSAYETSTMGELFAAVGYDLNRFAQDQALRNSASYGARWLGKGGPPTEIPGWFTQQLIALWALLDPVGNAGFEQFDAEFAGFVIMEARKSQRKSVKRDKYLPYARSLAGEVGALQIESTAQRLVAVAERARSNSLMSLAMSTKKTTADPNTELLAMIARAFVLARFSSAASADLISKAAVPQTQLDFWFAQAGTHTGLWSTSAPMSAIDVLADIKEDLSLLVDAEASHDLFDFLREGAPGLHRATSFGVLNVWIREDFESPLPV